MTSQSRGPPGTRTVSVRDERLHAHGLHRRIKPTKLSLGTKRPVCRSSGDSRTADRVRATSRFTETQRSTSRHLQTVLDNSSVTNRARLLGGTISRRCLMARRQTRLSRNISK